VIVAAVVGTIVGVLLIGLVVGFVAYYSIKKKRQAGKKLLFQ
jgi:hypothetical protein